MRFQSQRWIVLALVGFLLGAGAGAWKNRRGPQKETVMASSAALEKTQFAHAQGADAALLLARHLPLADAEKCAALAQEMLAKRVRVLVMEDPFDEKAKQYEEQYLPVHVWEGLFKRWMQVAPQAAWAFVEKHHSEELPLRAAALRQWALIDALAAVQAAGQEISKLEKKLILHSCIESGPLMGLHLLQQWKLIDSVRDGVMDDDDLSATQEILGSLLQRLAETSPELALEWCQSHAPKNVRDVCVGWMKLDASACYAWINDLPHEEQRSIYQLLADQPDVSVETVSRFVAMRDSADECDLFEPGLSAIARRDASLAQRLIGELFSNPMERIVLREQIAKATLSKDPRKAMDFIMPSLREPLPINIGPPLPQKTAPGHDYDRGPAYGQSADFFEEYLLLGENGGATKDAVLAWLKEIHPQHRSWMMDSSMNELLKMFGRNPEWLVGIADGIPRGDLDSFVSYLEHPSSAEIVADMKALPAGALRDAMVERALSQMLDEDQPVAAVVEKAKEWGGDVDWSEIYRVWLEEAPEDALRHLMSKPQARESEWHEVIHRSYTTHSEVLEQAVEQMPQGELRDSAVDAISYAAMDKKADVVTSIYWATEVKNRQDRNRLMQRLWAEWQGQEKTSQDPKVIDGVRQNIENSHLDASEKRRWLNRLESEVSR